jgi:hypothetical protein
VLLVCERGVWPMVIREVHGCCGSSESEVLKRAIVGKTDRYSFSE